MNKLIVICVAAMLGVSCLRAAEGAVPEWEQRKKVTVDGVSGYLYWNNRRSGNPVIGGFVADGAQVEDTVFIGPDAKVLGSASVEGDARVYGTAVISGDSRVRDKARVYGNSRVSDSVVIQGSAEIFGNAQISGMAIVEGSARVLGDALISGDANIRGRAVIRGFTERNNGEIKDVTVDEPMSEARKAQIAAAEAARQRQAEAREAARYASLWTPPGSQGRLWWAINVATPGIGYKTDLPPEVIRDMTGVGDNKKDEIAVCGDELSISTNRNALVFRGKLHGEMAVQCSTQDGPKITSIDDGIVSDKVACVFLDDTSTFEVPFGDIDSIKIYPERGNYGLCSRYCIINFRDYRDIKTSRHIVRRRLRSAQEAIDFALREYGKRGQINNVDAYKRKGSMAIPDFVKSREELWVDDGVWDKEFVISKRSVIIYGYGGTGFFANARDAGEFSGGTYRYYDADLGWLSLHRPVAPEWVLWLRNMEVFCRENGIKFYNQAAY